MYTRSSQETFVSAKVSFQLSPTYNTALFPSFHWPELTKDTCFKRSADLKWQILSRVVEKNNAKSTMSDTTTAAIEFKDTELISSDRIT